MIRAGSAIFLLLMTAAACSATARQPAAVSATAEEEPVSTGRAAVRDLPYSQGRVFSSLDEYLAFLRERGKYDVPWYREVSPGLYELVSRRAPGAPPQRFTRAELERRFGFGR